MEISNELKTIISLTTNGMIWIYILVFFILSYLFISLLTWSFVKPFKYLGIPTIITGILFLIIRFSSSIIINFINVDKNINLIKALLPSMLKPILYTSILCFTVGSAMLVLYKILNKKKQIVTAKNNNL